MNCLRANSEPGINTDSAPEKQSHLRHCGDSAFDYEVHWTPPAKKRIRVWQFVPRICKLVRIQNLEAPINPNHHSQLGGPVTLCLILERISCIEWWNKAEALLVGQLPVRHDPVPCLEASRQNALPMLMIGEINPF
jgi:hypothetical protein